ncbi:hypothetical protein F2P56_014966 [Juglans regia]|uniref:ERBB-3 BINDING PROTEIN 1-like n=2 Tax=Juglans regia TaxID=51240 RepID=A0A2I4E3Z9_JUGRE|nr:ERBB-3 BINDING PROTEIN 1-like [Juglans regia]KAF5464929.1 hypothetical protein F2P56_014966 [Juglans regia]
MVMPIESFLVWEDQAAGEGVEKKAMKDSQKLIVQEENGPKDEDEFVEEGVEKAPAREGNVAVAAKLTPKADSNIREKAGNMYKKVEKKIEREVAFPICISVNFTAGHFSPLASDETMLEEGDMLKIDIDCHRDGFIVVVAHT